MSQLQAFFPVSASVLEQARETVSASVREMAPVRALVTVLEMASVMGSPWGWEHFQAMA
jgi:hypothetical protein